MSDGFGKDLESYARGANGWRDGSAAAESAYHQAQEREALAKREWDKRFGNSASTQPQTQSTGTDSTSLEEMFAGLAGMAGGFMAAYALAQSLPQAAWYWYLVAFFGPAIGIAQILKGPLRFLLHGVVVIAQVAVGLAIIYGLLHIFGGID